jgi:hypothetical protein
VKGGGLREEGTLVKGPVDKRDDEDEEEGRGSPEMTIPDVTRAVGGQGRRCRFHCERMKRDNQAATQSGT